MKNPMAYLQVQIEIVCIAKNKNKKWHYPDDFGVKVVKKKRAQPYLPYIKHASAISPTGQFVGCAATVQFGWVTKWDMPRAV